MSEAETKKLMKLTKAELVEKLLESGGDNRTDKALKSCQPVTLAAVAYVTAQEAVVNNTDREVALDAYAQLREAVTAYKRS